MTDQAIPFSRPFPVDDVGEEPILISISANEDECAALARSLGVEAIASFGGDFQIAKMGRLRIRAAGELRTVLTQICVVTLDPFETAIVEPVAIDFAPPEAAAAAAARTPHAPLPGESLADQPDPPDPIVDGRIDLGVVATEFLALALDPYPRKPGVAFDPPQGEGARSGDVSPFAALEKLKKDGR